MYKKIVLYNGISLQAKNLVELAKKSFKDSSKTKILTITSGKGGVGKSTITANLAYILSKRNYKVAVLDADIGLANLQVIFDIKPQNSFFDFINSKCSLEESITKTSYENIYLIAGKSGYEYTQNSSSLIFTRVIDEIKALNRFDFLIIDTGAGLNSYVKEFLSVSDNILAISTTDPSSITDVYTLMKMLSIDKKSLMLCFNHTNSYEIGSKISQSLLALAKKNSLNSEFMVKYLGNLSSSTNLATTSRLRKLFVKEFSNENFSLELEKISNKVIENIE